VASPQREYLDRIGLDPQIGNILRRSALEYERTGRFVDLDTLADEALTTTDGWNPNGYVHLPSEFGCLDHEERIGLTGFGLLASESAPQTCQTLAQLARICADRWRSRQGGKAEISAEILEREYAFDRRLAQRSDLIQKIPGVTSGGSLGEQWRLDIFRSALVYREVENADDLFTILMQQADERRSGVAESIAAAQSLGIVSESFIDLEYPVIPTTTTESTVTVSGDNNQIIVQSPGAAQKQLNIEVGDLDGLLEALRSLGIADDPLIELRELMETELNQDSRVYRALQWAKAQALTAPLGIGTGVISGILLRHFGLG
jgi:hypothetical protein